MRGRISLGQRLWASTALQSVAAAAVLLAAPLPAAAQLSPNAHPTGGAVVAGAASIGQNATTTTINQSSQRAAVNWQTYNVGNAQTVQYKQPNASAVTLNTVVGSNPSEIAGKIQANGQIVIVNQAGLVFDKGAQINTSGIVVSAAGISTSNFMAGKMVFDQAANAGAKVENRGTITVNNEGLAALVAPRVRNSGKIQAKMGTVILAGAEAETLDLYGDGLVSINVTKQVASAPDGTKALVTNSGVIEARGGTVVLTADAVDGVVQTLVDAGGHISANSTASRTGRVLISGAGGDVRVEGVVTAEGNAPGTAGGEVKVSGSDTTIIGAHARISASGKAGGGTVALGTTLKRAKDGATGIAAATTKTLVVSKGSTITADATVNGNGGRIVGLASGTTTMAGTITAKGGAQGGNGGYVEISGGKVVPSGLIDTSAPKGVMGMTLFDPTDVWISDSQPAGTSPGTSWLAPSYLEGLPSNVSVTTVGDINVASSAPGMGITNSLLLGTKSLTLFAGANLTVDQGFSISASTILLNTSAGSITLNGASGVTGGIITAAQLGMLAPTSILAPTYVDVLGSGVITMSSAGAIALGPATVGSVAVPLNELDVSAATGITQDPAGAIYATTLRSVEVAGDVGLFGTGNQIARLPLFAVTGGDFALVDSSALTATSVSANNVFLQVTGGNALTLARGSDITTGSASSGRVSLVADTLTVPNTATITGGTVEIAPNTPGVPVSVLPATPPPGALTIDTQLLARLNAQTLRIGGYTDVPDGTFALTPTSGSIDLAAALDLHGSATTLDLESLGAVTQEGPLTVRTLTGNAGAVTLNDPGNDVTNLGGFTAASLTLNDPDVTSSLHVTGLVDAPIVSLTAPDIRIESTGAIQASTSTTLIANGSGGGGGGGCGEDCDEALLVAGTSGNIVEVGGIGTIDTALLTGSANGHVTLDGANDVAALGAFSVGGNFLLNNGLNPLQVVGAFSGAGQKMTLYAGDISQSGDGVITAGSLTGTATNVNLGTATGGNAIARLLDFAVTGGDFILANGRRLDVEGTVDANAIYLQTLNGTALALAPTASLQTDPATGLVSLVADRLNVQAGAAVVGGTVEIAPNTTGLAVSILPATPPAHTLTIDQTALSAIDTTTLRIGAFTDAPDGAPTYGTPTAGSIDIASALTLTGTASILDLETTGAVTQEGPLVVNELTGSAGPLTLTTPGNAIAYLGAFAASGPFNLDDGANALEIVGAFSGAGQTLTLNAGPISQSGAGAVTAGLLTGNAASLDLSTATNAIADLGPFTAPGGIVLNDSVGALTVVGALDGGPGVTLVNTGSLGIDAPIDPSNTVALVANGISQTSNGVITAGVLTGSAGSGDAALGEAQNLVTDLGTFTAGGVFNLLDAVPALTVIGPVSGGAGVQLTNYGNLVIDAGLTSPGYVLLTGYAVSQSASGVIDAGSLAGFADAPAGSFNGGFALGTATNMVGQLGGFGTTGYFALLDGESLTVNGNGAASGDVSITVNGAGNVLAVAPGTTLASGATNTIALTSTGGDVDNGGSLVGGALVDLAAGGTIMQSGVAIADAITETAANDIDHAGTSMATNGGLTLTAGGSINQSAGPGGGLLEASGGTIVLLANGTTPTYAITQQAGAAIIDTTPGQTISLASGSGIAFAGIIGAAYSTGSLANPIGPVSLTAANGDITETYGGSHTGILSALTLTGSAPNGSALLDAPSVTGTTNQVAALGNFSTGGGFTLVDGHDLAFGATLTAGTSAILTVPQGNLTDSGTITAPNIQLSAPSGTATVSGTLAGVVADPTLNPQAKLTFPSNPGTGAWIIGGNIVLAPGIKVIGAGGGAAELVLDLTSAQGLANLGNFNSPSTDLYLNLGLGRAAGQIAVQALQVQYTDPGTSQLIDLTGTVRGLGGFAAAAAGFIYPRVNVNYQLNGCPIGAAGCGLSQFEVPVFFGIPEFLFPFINPLKDLEVESPGEAEDILIILPDVGERDY
jgi:filamentous hemagglutinin family protein